MARRDTRSPGFFDLIHQRVDRGRAAGALGPHLPRGSAVLVGLSLLLKPDETWAPIECIVSALWTRSK
jgi:hypothetical protein